MPAKPIIIIKKKAAHGGHHGGAWKVAYADFVTAMMALFIVLWLMSSSEKVKKAVAGYFNDPKGTSTLMGTTMTGTGETVTAATNDNLQKLKEKLEQEIKQRPDLQKLAKQIEITITPEGLRIELIEGKNGTFFQSGSAEVSASGQELLALLGSELKTIPNELLIEGHTDAAPYSASTNYGNWELSADRANSARRLLQQDGVRSNQVTQVRGYADQLLRVKSNPFDPSNRRISILVKNADASMAASLHGTVADTPPPPPAAAAKPTAAAGTAPATNHAAAPTAKAPAPTSAPTAASTPAKPSAATPAAKPGLVDKFKSMLPGAKKQ